MLKNIGIILTGVTLALSLTQCKARGAKKKASALRSDWSPESEWESLGNGKQRRKWVIEWQCAIREHEGGKKQDEYCEWARKKVNPDGSLLCEFNTNFMKNRKYYLPMRFDPDLSEIDRDLFWEHTQFNTYRDLVALVRECSVKNAHCDKNKISETISSNQQCKNDDVDAQFKCLESHYPRCHRDCYAAVPYLAKNCIEKGSEECAALEATDSKPNEIKNCRNLHPAAADAKKCVESIAAKCEQPCRVACDPFRSSDPQVCGDLQRVLYDEGGEVQPVEHKVVTDVQGDKVIYASRLLVQIQATSPDSLPQGCAYDVDPTLKQKLTAAGWGKDKLDEYARQEKTFVACNLTSSETTSQGVKTCDDIAVHLRSGTQAYIVTDE
ncbi:MAG: hypothetical protein AB7T49_07445 [Oligoflexales bacterium]